LTTVGKTTCKDPELESLVYGVMQSLLEERTTVNPRIVPDAIADPVDRVVGTALPPLPTINVR
jgi:hypothetical protein